MGVDPPLNIKHPEEFLISGGRFVLGGHGCRVMHWKAFMCDMRFGFPRAASLINRKFKNDKNIEENSSSKALPNINIPPLIVKTSGVLSARKTDSQTAECSNP